MSNNQIVPLGEPLPREYEELSRDELKLRLTVFIQEMLDSDFEKLISMMYRHDVSEAKFHEALENGDLPEQAVRLSELVIEREMQKLEMRKAYRKHK